MHIFVFVFKLFCMNIAMDKELQNELDMLRHMARQLADNHFRVKAAYWDKHGEAPLENLEILAENGLAGITVNQKFGGSGATILHAVVAVEEIARACTPTAAFILANCTSAEILQQFGTEEHQDKYLPGIVSGELLGCWAMTEPDAGSAASEMRTRAVRDNDHYVISGNKSFITRAAIADFFIVFARIGDTPGSKGIGAFIIDKGTSGLSVGSLDNHMGLKGGASAEVILEECRVHKTSMIVDAGSFSRIMKGLNQARVLNPAMCLGIATEAFTLAARYMTERKVFGKELKNFQGLQWMIADMATSLEAMRLLIYRAAEMLADNDPAVAHNAAIAKLYSGEAAFKICDQAMQIHGGYGYSTEFPLERLLRDVRAFQLGGGTNEILRTRIAANIFENI